MAVGRTARWAVEKERGKNPRPTVSARSVDCVERRYRKVQYSESESGFFAIKISEAFEFRPDWYRKGPVAGGVLEYYWLLRSVLREKPEARRCLCRCRHCRIFFITDPRNAGRVDLGCPFGCREAYRKRESTRRSVAYYREPEGKIKRRHLNSKRSQHSGVVVSGPSEVPCEHCRWSEPLLEHVRTVSGLIEGRRVSREEVVQMLGEVLRQHSMARRRRLDHLVAQLHQNPP